MFPNIRPKLGFKKPKRYIAVEIFHNILRKQPRTKEIRRCLIFFHPGKNSMLTRPMLSIRILFTNYDIITDFLNLAFCSEHFISIKHRILATFDVNKKFNSDSLCTFKSLTFVVHICRHFKINDSLMETMRYWYLRLQKSEKAMPRLPLVCLYPFYIV